MKCIHQLTWTIDTNDEEQDVKLEIEFEFTRGYPEEGPSYASGGEPGAPDDVDIEYAWVVDGANRQPVSPDVFMALAKSETLREKLIEVALDQVRG